MPIYSLEGTPGSGKTLYCVQKIIPEFLKIRDSRGELVPRHIYTNIEGIKPELICALAGIPYETIAEYFHVLGEQVDEKGHRYEDKDYVRYWYYEPDSIEWVQEQNGAKQIERHPDWNKARMIPVGSLIIIDEIQNYYSNRDFQTIYSKRCIDYVTKNRHYGWTLWWMSQSVESVDVTFRRNTEQVWFLERLENYGQPNKASVKIYEGWQAGNKVNIPPMATRKFSYDSRYYECYHSYVAGVTKEKRYKTNVFLNNRWIVGCAIVLAICIVMIIVNPPSSLFGRISGQKSPKPTATAPTDHSFSGLLGAGAVSSRQAEEAKKDTAGVCVTHSYVLNDEVYLVYNTGKVRKATAGGKYEECE